MFATAVMEAYGIAGRRVVLADSFAGLPHASQGEDRDVWAGAADGYLAVPLDTVKRNFDALGLPHGELIVIHHSGSLNRRDLKLNRKGPTLNRRPR